MTSICNGQFKKRVSMNLEQELISMKKKIPIMCNVIRAILGIVFIVKSIADYYEYMNSFTSAPFSLWIEVNALFLIVPAIIVFVVGVFLRRK